MGYTYSFFDNQTIGAADLNKLAKKFVTQGIADIFTDGLPYNVSILNEIVTANATDGTVAETDTSLKVYISGGKVHISSGTAFFADGTMIEVDSEGIVLSYTNNSINYVYLISDSTTNSCRAECSLKTLTGNVLLLAVIEKDGTVTDKRKYAKGKIASCYSSGRGLITKTTISWTEAEISNSTPKEFPIDTDMASGLFSYVNNSRSKTKTLGFVNFKPNGQGANYISACSLGGSDTLHGYAGFSTNHLILQNAYDIGILLAVKASVSNGKVTITPIASVSNKGHGLTVDFYTF